MEYDAFLREVRNRASLASDDTADDAVGATLTTLSERLPDDETRDLAEQLPDEVGEYLTVADGAQSFDYDEFVARVQKREGATSPEHRAAAERHARVVTAVLLDAVQSEDTDDVLTYLTRDYEDLFALVDPEDVWGPGWRDRLGQRG